MLIHRFEFDDNYIVLDINSGSVHVVDQLVYDLLEVFDGKNEAETKNAFASKYTPAEIKEGIEEIQELIAEELLFTPLMQEAKDVFTEQPIVKSLCLHIAHDCNLRCRYCFASMGDFGGSRSLMSKEIGEKAVDFAIAGSQNRTNLDIDFFGGEPLVNPEVVRHLIKYVRQREKVSGKKIKLTLTTNGLLLDDAMSEYLNENNVLLVLSLDGRPEVHDKMRPTTGGQGSYEKTARAFKKIIDSRDGKNYYLRGTYTKENLDFTEDVKHMATIGKELSMEPVVEKEADYKISEEDLPTIFQEYEKLAKYYLTEHLAGRPFNFFHFNMALDGGPCLPKRLSGCGAGHEYFAITPEGDIYPCHQFVGREEYKLGTLDTGLEKPEISHEFRKAHVLNKPTCLECWARFHCSGGCHANADLINGDIYQPYAIGCQLQKKRLECAIGVQTVLALMEQE